MCNKGVTPSIGTLDGKLKILDSADRDEFLGAVRALAGLYQDMPKHWEGRKCVRELRERSTQWKQMEWFGWYWELLAQERAPEVFDANKPTFFNTRFDGYAGVPWDLKAHALLDVNGREGRGVVLNDAAAIDACVSAYGLVCVAVLLGDAKFDHDGSFRRWHEDLKGSPSVYQQSNPSRRTRMRKSSFLVKSLHIFAIGKEDVDKLRPFHQGRNSNGRPRPHKYMLGEVQPDFVMGHGS